MEAKNRIILPLDVDSLDKAAALVNQLFDLVGPFKLGLEFINSMLASIITPSAEAEAIENVQKIRKLFGALAGKIFWDGKFDDIPNTMAGASVPVAKMGVKMFNVHASAGKDSVAKAVANKGKSLVLGVTVLTSISPNECESIFGDKPGPKVLQFAKMLVDVGADGIICSPQELEFLGRDPELKKLLKATPGVRPLWAAAGDQKRVMTPGEAIKAGADYLVIGRPITQPPKEIGGPADAAKLIAAEIAAAWAERRSLEIFAQTKAIIKNTHVVYTSGKHGSEYVNKDEVYPDTEVTDELCGYIAEHFKELGAETVVAPVEGGINLSQGVARHLTRITGQKVFSVYADKEGDGLVIKRGYGKHIAGKKVLVVDDVFTTGGSVRKLIVLVRSMGGIVMAVGGLCNRGGVKAADLGENVPEPFVLASVQMEAYEEALCPLCKENVPISTEVGKGKEYLAQKASVAK
ncbi:MAG: orotidine-5'-phosphate decarboxylase [Candidatus Yanofskybacteria bacterium]|nr:orotidine-5'-phosphate decarboxylase [Candidatus Yanofskybacteria bacterium]